MRSKARKNFWILVADGSTLLTRGFGFWIKRQPNHYMNVFSSQSLSGNRKSKTCTEPSRSIENLKSLVLSVIAFVLVVVGAAQAQQPPKIPRIGFLSANSRTAMSARAETFQQGLRELGYVEGKNIVIEYQFADRNLDRVPALAAELVRLNVNVIVTEGPTATRFAKEATSTIPIVMTNEGDPVGTGFVASLARPGGNITG